MKRSVLPWAIVLLEVVSPLPAFLTLGAVYVLLARPDWFRRWVEDLYAERSAAR